MKYLFALLTFFISAVTLAKDSVGVVEPQQTSTGNYDLLWIAVAGLILLIAFYFLFRRTRRIKN